MHASTLLKTLPVALLALCLQMPNAFAGATNRDENTAATPGEKSTTTDTPTDAGHERRKGTTNTDDMKSSKSKKSGKQDMEQDSTSGSGSSSTGTSGQ